MAASNEELKNKILARRPNGPQLPSMASSSQGMPIEGTSYTLEGAERLAQVLCAAGYHQDIRDTAQGVYKILAGAEFGLGPVASLQGIYVLKGGKVGFEAQLLAAIVRKQGYEIKLIGVNEKAAQIEFFYRGESVGKSTYTIEDAQRAGLAEREVWRRHPKNMLFARALSNGCKMHCAGCFGGHTPYVPDELEEIDSSIEVKAEPVFLDVEEGSLTQLGDSEIPEVGDFSISSEGRPDTGKTLNEVYKEKGRAGLEEIIEDEAFYSVTEVEMTQRALTSMEDKA